MLEKCVIVLFGELLCLQSVRSRWFRTYLSDVYNNLLYYIYQIVHLISQPKKKFSLRPMSQSVDIAWILILYVCYSLTRYVAYVICF